MFAGNVQGRAEIKRVQGILAGAPKELQANVRKRMRGALNPLKQEIPAAALARLPHSGGYAALLSKATKVEIRITTARSVKADVKVSASGKREGRDVPAVNRGVLRHPVFGDRSRWVRQAVKPQFVDDPVAKAADRVAEAVRDSRDDLAEHILKG